MDWVRFLFLFPLPPRVLQQTGSEFSVRQQSFSGFKSWCWCLEAVLWPGDLAEFPSSASMTSWSSFLHFTIHSFFDMVTENYLCTLRLNPSHIRLCATSQPCGLTWLYLHSHGHRAAVSHVSVSELQSWWLQSTFCTLLTARWHRVWPGSSHEGTCVAPGSLGKLKVGTFLPSGCVNVTTPDCGMPALPPVLVPAWWHGIISQLTCCWDTEFRVCHQKLALPEVRIVEGSLRRGWWVLQCSSREKLEVGWTCCWERKEEWDFATRGKWCGWSATSQFSVCSPICFDINTHSRAMSRHEDDAYPHTCDLWGFLLLFEEWAWCFNVLFGDSSI